MKKTVLSLFIFWMLLLIGITSAQEPPARVKFFPSIHPSLLNSCRNASTRTAIPEAVLGSRKPMRKIFPVCCA